MKILPFPRFKDAEKSVEQRQYEMIATLIEEVEYLTKRQDDMLELINRLSQLPASSDNP